MIIDCSLAAAALLTRLALVAPSDLVLEVAVPALLCVVRRLLDDDDPYPPGQLLGS